MGVQHTRVVLGAVACRLASKQRTETQTGLVSPLLSPRGAELASQEGPQSDGGLPAGLFPLVSTVRTPAEKMVPPAHHRPLESVHTRPWSSPNCPAPPTCNTHV